MISKGLLVAAAPMAQTRLLAMWQQAEKQEQEKDAGEFKELIDQVKEVLGDKVKEVRITHRLTSSPACLVADAHDLGGNLARMLKSMGQEAPQTKPILEINPHHPIVQKLKGEAGSERFGDWSHLLFDQALLAEGGQLDDPARFVQRLNGLLLTMAGS